MTWGTTTRMFKTDMPNVVLDGSSFIYVCGEKLGFTLSSIRIGNKQQIVDLRNRHIPGSYAWQFLQCYLDRGRKLIKGDEILTDPGDDAV